MITIYKHIKTGGRYLFIMNAKDEADAVDVVVYQSIDTGQVWVRPAVEFFDEARFVKVA